MQLINLKNNNNYELIKKAGNAIKKGKLVIFPTETVYGIGADGLNSNAVSNIFKAKGRKNDNPLILHVCNKNMVNKIAKDITDLEYQLMKDLWPGPFTIVLNKKDIVPDIVTGNLSTVGVRMPSNEIALKLIEYANTPIAAPSANISGKPSGTNINDIIEELKDSVEYIIDNGDTKIGLESTVVRVIDDKINILRPGYITKEDLENYGEVIIDKHILNNINDNSKVLSPGMKYKHYAPNTKCVLVYGKDNLKLINKIKQLETNNTLVLCKFSNVNNYYNAISMGETLEEISHNIFKLLREIDNKNVDLVIIEGVSKKGLGLAIMNRLIRACAYNYIEI
ncbi:MAG TPA: L-threonylcarbamoyladenylate synthase [Bacilli bacterium]|nr:L-threonylcarbamoyladenylate synthase [Bacilli bacterium]